MLKVSGSESMRTGFAFNQVTMWALATKVNAGTITSSPCLIL